MVSLLTRCGIALASVGLLAASVHAQQERKNAMVVLRTSEGDIKVELFEKEAPISTANFLEYVKSDFFDGTIFHRVIAGFMIQGGGFTEEMKRKETREPIKNEGGNGLKNEKYTLAMARTNVPDSATSQFFINVADNDFLNRERAGDGVGYAVFGRVVEGHDVVDRIAKVKTGTKNGMQDVPDKSVRIEKVERVEP